MQRLLIVGKNFSGLTKYLRENSYDYIVLKDIKDAKHPGKKLKRRVLCDFASKDAIFVAVDGIRQPIHGVISVYENYVLSAAWIAEHLGLPGMPPDAAEACTDKWLMRQLFAAAPEKISPAFTLVNSEDDLRAFARNHAFPLILKPANLAKSLLVTKNHSLSELLANYQKTLDNVYLVYDKYAPGRAPRLLVEEFLEGSIHSVDAFVDSNGEPEILEQIVDYQTGYDIGFEDNFHYSRLLPSRLSTEEQKALRHAALVGIKALGMKSSPAHVEIIMTAKGPRIVEIGARNGGYRERMHSLANGIDIPGLAIDTVLGAKPDIHAAKNEACGVMELFPKHPGAFQSLENEEILRSLPSLVYLDVKVKPGQYVGRASDGYKMCAVVILHNPDADQFTKDLQYLNEHVRIVTE